MEKACKIRKHIKTKPKTHKAPSSQHHEYHFNQYFQERLIQDFNTFRRRQTKMVRTPSKRPKKVPLDRCMPWNLKCLFKSSRYRIPKRRKPGIMVQRIQRPRTSQNFSRLWRTHSTLQLKPCLNAISIKQVTYEIGVSHVQLFSTKIPITNSKVTTLFLSTSSSVAQVVLKCKSDPSLV